jgi:pyruvate kinase
MYQQAFIIDAPVSNSPVITAARMLSEHLAANVLITRERISHVLTSITGGSDADKA